MEINFPKIDKKILKFWKKNRIFKMSIERRKKASNFVFYEGPPTANAKPGFHHALSRSFKDIICRYKTMQGFKVLRKAGWDTHGLPVELEVEKKLGLKSKKEIEKYGITKFNKKCRESVWDYKKDWEKLTERIGFWLDMENPYITYQPDYIESVWWIIKQAWQKKLLYKDYKVVPYCTRCGTSLSSHEVAQGYKKIKEPAIYVKFPVLNPEFKDTSLLIWTTTPWTLPGNVAVAVNPEIDYVKVKSDEEYLILAKEKIGPCDIKGEIIREFKGKDLINLRYQPLYSSAEEIIKKAYRVITADFVSLEEGSGLVHIAPAFGEEDMKAGKKNDLPVLLTVDKEGKFRMEIKNFARMFVKDADPMIIEDLKNRNLLFKTELYEHDYPFCWRCHSPLLYYAKESWFVAMAKIKEDLIKNNQKINWIPAHLKKGRFGEWLRGVKDWALTRERYWGTPFPVWQCQQEKPEEKCGHIEVIGSLKDLLGQKFSNNNYYFFRHGHSQRQILNLASCWPEKKQLPLTEKGKKQVLKSARKIKNRGIDLIFSSDLLRTKQTAEIISKETGAKIIFDKNLREANVGIFNGHHPKLFWDYILKKQNPCLAKAPKGESLVDIQKRVHGFLKKIDKKYHGKNIVLVSHEFPLTVLEKTLEGRFIENIVGWRRKNMKKLIKTGQGIKIEFKSPPFNEKMEIDFHRPYIDEVKFYCPKCGSAMQRTPEVIDCWFDSGSMPFAQYHYPFDNKELIDKKIQFPADYISEAIDQTRGWFYTLLAISSLLGKGPAYKNVLSAGHVLDEKGEKMSKSKGNVVDPWHITEKYGADSVRWYFYTINQPGDYKLFSEKDVDQALKKFILTFWNCFVFYNTYKKNTKPQLKSKNLLDRWILSKLNGLIQETTEKFDEYDIVAAARAIEGFIVNDFSLWYIRRSRKRFEEAACTLQYALLVLIRLTAPFIPFLSEHIYQGFKSEKLNYKSVHLEDWPKAEKNSINKKLEKKMEKVREIVTKSLAERSKAKIKIRQPLNQLIIKNYELKKEAELLNLIKEEVNIKKIVFDAKIKEELKLDTEITPQLKEEGIIREIIRQIQERRKNAGLKPKDKIFVAYCGSEELDEILERNKDLILEEGKIKNLIKKEKKEEIFAAEKEVAVDRQKLYLAIYPVKDRRCQIKKTGKLGL